MSRETENHGCGGEAKAARTQRGGAPEQITEVQAASWCGGSTDYLRGEELDEITLEEGREERTEDREKGSDETGGLAVLQ